MISKEVLDSPLGKQVDYLDQYTPSLLCAIPRHNIWKDYNYKKPPYNGCDIWNAYELSWLNENGLPIVVVAEFQIPIDSPNLIESKSFKLYLNSFSQTNFKNKDEVCKTLVSDLSACAGKPVKVTLFSLSDKRNSILDFDGICLDDMDINISNYNRDASFLKTKEDTVNNEKLYSHLLKSNCPITGQPDWGSIYIEYSGKTIEHTGLLKYIISYRKHCDFHEKCTENIFLDIMQQCQPDELTVYTRYLRRGGLDINPFRSTNKDIPENIRLSRQ